MDDSSELKTENEESRDPSGLRTVVILRGDKGYGLTVSGESPVIVQDVKEGGPAALSGVKKGDSIIKVNDTLVSKVNHTDVVSIIKSSRRVKLTLHSGDDVGQVLNDLTHKAFAPSSSGCPKLGELITSPLPVNTQLQSKLEENRVKMLHKFLEKQQNLKESIIMELNKAPSKNMQKSLEKELESVNRQINTFMEELKNVREVDNQLQMHSRSSRSPPPSRNSGSFQPNPHPHPYQQHSRSSSSSSSNALLPPPLPARNRTLISQISAPNVTSSLFSLIAPHPYSNSSNLVSSASSNTKLSGGASQSMSVGAPPPLPPRPPHMEKKGEDVGHAQSLENIPKISNLVHSNSSGSDSSTRQSHHRVKSSPDPLGMQSSPGSNRHSGCESVGGDPSFWNKVSFISESEPQPPGTPPPPYLNPSLVPSTEEAADDNYCAILDETLSSSSILTMEEEDGDVIVKDHGPFMSLNKLMKHNAYLAVFVNYIITNYDPSSLFFYMITDLYREGGAKERKKWAYEIHSSFLLPGAPMRLSNIDESVLYEIDETLQKDLDKEEILKKLFWKARHRSREDLNDLLADFRSKRSAGLGNLFGPPDSVLEETILNKTKEIVEVERLLIQSLESISVDLKNQSDQMIVMASSLATILWKYFNVRSPHALSIIDRCPLFVNRDRPLKNKLLRGSKKQVVRDHSFILTTYYSVSYCNHCGVVIWGVAPQGYQCANCEMNIHKACVKHVEESCVGQVHKNERGKDTVLGSIISRIRPDEREKMNRKSSQVNPGHIKEAKILQEDTILANFPEYEGLPGEKASSGSSGPSTKEQRRSDPGTGGAGPCQGASSLGGGAPSNNHQSNNGGPLEEELPVPLEDGDDPLGDFFFALSSAASSSTDNASNNISKSQSSVHKKRGSGAINRSESCKEKHHQRKQTRETRKNSDPNIPTSKPGDVDGESALTFDSGSSSNSSLSQSQESPPGNSAEQVQDYASPLDSDSDIEADVDLPDWTQRLSTEELERLSSKDRKRHDTINEFFHTEQSHVRVLKVLKYLFHQPLRQNNYLSSELLDLLFPNLDQMLKFHTSFNKAMKKRRQESPLVTNVGDILMSMFDGEEGAQFQQAAAEFVASQSFALESLKQQQKREPKLANFLQDQENHRHCRRLQLKDMLPAGFQRLSKYPLLLESLLSYTDRSKQLEEYDQILKALERSREILAYVNAAVQEAENQRRLREIQKRLDQSSLIKNKHGKEEVRMELDLTKHNLIYEGPLTWKTRGQKSIDLHVLLLEEGVVLLQKDNDKYVLRYHPISKSMGKDGKDDNKLNHFPIIKFGTFLFRPVATDKCAFFLVLTQTTLSAQIYELVAMSPNEAKVWLKHLQDAQTAYDARGGRRSQAPPNIPDPDEPTQPSDHLRVRDEYEGEASDSVDLMPNFTSLRTKQEQQNEASSSSTQNSTSLPTNSHSPPSPESLISKKSESGGGGGSAGGGASTPGGGGLLPGPSQLPPGSQASSTQGRSRRLQEVQIIQIVEGSSLIQPSEVKISQGVVLSAEPVLTPIELLRRKDIKIREELQIKQDLIADILNIPRQHFESVADMAGEMGLSNKEPRELVLGSIYQAKKLQEALNEAQALRECDIMSAQACSDSSRATSLPLYPAPMEKLLNISGNLTQLLNALLSLVSERDDERDRMRKELVASRERLHQLHMQQNKTDPALSLEAAAPPLCGPPSTGGGAALASATDPTSPHSSRPSSFVSVGSSAADQSEAVPDQPNTEEDGRGEEPQNIPLSHNIIAEGTLSKCSDTSDGDAGALSQTSISEESEVLRVPASVEPSSPTLTEDTGST